MIFSPIASVVILLLAFLQLQHGTLRAIGLVIGLPVIAVLFLVALRSLRPENPD
jgi:hypothetical protein